MRIFPRSILVTALTGVLALPVFAASPSPSPAPKRSIDLACVQTAVEKRDNTVIAAFDAFTSSVRAALVTRRDALKAAWGNADRAERHAAIRTTWATFRNSRRAARQTWHAARRAAWRQFHVDRRACRVPFPAAEVGGEASDAQI